MTIINAFDDSSEAIVTPQRNIRPIEDFPQTVIATFSSKFQDLVTARFATEQIGAMVAGSTVPILRLMYRGMPVAFYLTPLGGPAASALLEEIIAYGGRKMLFFGSCGSLDTAISSGHLIVPTAAYRDEGTSYHYLPASDFIQVETADATARILDELHVPYTCTKTWTTDGFYRETRNHVEARRRAGCAAVEMECASIMAVGQFRDVAVHQFLYAADCLDGAVWDERILGKMPADMIERLLDVALETAVRL
ncbi:nucleoside phosphorylase [Bifidobacterium sp.]|jgi:uridine phosphorylase|uniref:nucleoside phosphorylase n=1 Tax=Bifidobacterium sp. TaxID=41200 RepID=UPI0025C5FB2A|nr:nucleoside phosphorylase [Bifidobacterium sp.]MCH4209194.1 nucleoside phosphorylase [Bifidobacterium sp.]MCI1224640.1 nucleoside phosphorylase [Bifidobacterium sp.]